ncbi:nucleolar protein 58-like [Eutrema salsugineum]|uniref:nucleolar protein 58-like n=1 Tax=Eutrema salsugineum TaxID=72664 RepID=UPI000CED6FE1|nr:nucleolar protein 58-like [Eutrema salsugineum]
MAPIQVNPPSLAARLKAKKSGNKDRGPSASRPEHSDRAPVVQEEVKAVSQRDANLESVAEGGVETQIAEDQVATRQADDEADEATQSARREEKKQKKKKHEEKKQRKEEIEADRLAEKEEVAKAKAKEKRKKPSGEGNDGGQVGGEEASK